MIELQTNKGGGVSGASKRRLQHVQKIQRGPALKGALTARGVLTAELEQYRGIRCSESTWQKGKTDAMPTKRKRGIRKREGGKKEKKALR